MSINLEELQAPKIKPKHIFMASRVIDAAMLKLEINALVSSDEFRDAVTKSQAAASNSNRAMIQAVVASLGISGITGFLSKIWKAEKEINALLADLYGVEVKDIQDLEVEDYIELFIRIGKAPGIDRFLASVDRTS